MKAPVIKKTSIEQDIYIERTLPVPGQVITEVGAVIAPYEHIGICTFSQKTLKLSNKFQPNKFKKSGQFYYVHSKLGKEGSSKVIAPFNGNLIKSNEGSFEFKEEQKKYILLSGVWGQVDKIVDKNSVLLKTNAADLNLVVATNTTFAGELVVFPNPTRLLERFYLESFGSDSADGKIIYAGNQVSMAFVKDAVKFGIGAIIGGSADKETFNFAQKAGMSFGLFSGFGDISTPDVVYNLLNTVASRYVFFQGERNLLRIPIPKEDSVVSINNTLPTISEVKQGSNVVILQKPYFGSSAIVDSVSESSIFVRFSMNEKPVEIFLPNFFLLQN